jgi:uncharacterized membrane protein YkvA (DUF1232 family)
MSQDGNEQNNEAFDEEGFFNLMMNGEVPITFKLIVVIIPVLYTLMPIDLLPEALLGPLGLVDDAGVWMLGAQLFTNMANKHLEKKHEAEQAEAATIIQEPTHSASAQSAASPYAPVNNPAPSSSVQPRLPEHHLRRHGRQPEALPAKARQPLGYDTSALTDEEHEKLILQKNNMSDAAFNEMMRERGYQRINEWDFSRNDAFSKRRNAKDKPSS